jgi:cell wall assembly regulator SMI1
MVPLVASFAEFISHLSQVHRPSVELLAPPASEAELAQFEAWLGRPLSKQAREVYTLHNGQLTSLSPFEFLDRKLLSLAEVLEQMRIPADVRPLGIVDDSDIEDDRVSENFPSLGHIPIFSDETGNFIGYDLKPSPKGRVGQVLVFGADVGVEVVFNSLNELWGALNAELEAGHWTIEGNEKTATSQFRFRDERDWMKTLMR